jgi:hypothetical protein
MLNSATKEKIERTREYLLESDLPEDAKDNLQSLLDFSAEAANGSTDKIKDMAQAQLQSAMFHVKNAVRTPNVIKDIVAQHAANCPGKKIVAAPQPALTGKLAALYAFRWPICIIISVIVLAAFLSGNFPALLSLAEKALK